MSQTQYIGQFFISLNNNDYLVVYHHEKPGHYMYQVHQIVPNKRPLQMLYVGKFVYEVREGQQKLMEALNDLEKHLHVPDPYGVLGKIKQFCQSEAYKYYMVEEFADEIVDLCNGVPQRTE